MQAWRAQAGHQLYLPADPAAALADADKVAWLERVDREARKLDPRVVHVMASLVAVHEVVLIATSDGELAADVRPLVRFNVSVIVEQNGRREQGYAGGGGRYSLAELVAGDRPLALAREAVRQALVNLEAVPAPAGTMTVVLGPGWPGILLHEAIGHGLEGDFNRKGTSAFAGRIGERVAAPECTVVDDGTLVAPPRLAQHRRRGHADAVHDADRERRAARLHAGPAQRAPDGRAAHRQRPARILRAHDAAAHDQHLHAPGPHAPEEIIRSVERGIYAVNFGGGQVDITSGKFVFSASEAYLIENGQHRRAGQGRDADRQRPRRAHARLDGRQRPEARRRRRHLRQGRPERAGGRRPADPARSMA